MNIKISEDISIPPLGTRQVNVLLDKVPTKGTQALITIDPDVALKARLRLLTAITIVENGSKEQVLLIENAGGKPVFLYCGDIIAQMSFIKQAKPQAPTKPQAKQNKKESN